jgi:hypothetical protein
MMCLPFEALDSGVSVLLWKRQYVDAACKVEYGGD